MRSRVSNRLVLFYCLTVLAVLTVGIFFALKTPTVEAKASDRGDNLGSVSFPGSNTGAIPDGGTCPAVLSSRDVTFDVTGLSGSITDIELDMDLTHSWVGDLRVSLIAPDATSHVIFSRLGSTSGDCFGDSSDFGGAYNFNDVGDGTNFWTAAAGVGGSSIVPTGNYRTIGAGPSDSTPAETDFAAAYSGISSVNGTWTLRVEDGSQGDTGSVNSASLLLTTDGAAAASAPTDFNGDGTSDETIVRAGAGAAATDQGSFIRTGSVRERMRLIADAVGKGDTGANLGAPPTPGTAVDWYISNSGGGGSTVSSFGGLTDFFIPADFDGDGKSDLAVWRGLNTTGPGGAYFLIMRSSDSTLDTVDFGVIGDNPTVTGDYDGDGKADPAVFRCPSGGGQCSFYYKGSNNNPGGDVSFVPWGFGDPFTVFPAVGDFDGDGKNDFCVQTAVTGTTGPAVFTLLRSSDFGVEYTQWGLADDFIVPADFDGDGKTDYTVARNDGGQFVWYSLLSGGGTGGIAWGNAATDYIVVGDFDGDGKTDPTIFRSGDWFILKSSDGSVAGYDWGQNLDYPVGNWQVQ